MILFIPFDFFLGIRAMMTKDPYNTFLSNIKDSEDGYADEDAKRVGIIPIPPTVFWHHLQRRGKCCGLYSFEEWRNTTVGTKYYSVPDSCCKDEYKYEGCGELAWKHPNHYKHSLASIVHERGCIAIFPKVLRNDDRYTISIFGKVVASLLILCLLISIVLFILVIVKKFKPAEGLNNPTFVDAQVEPERRGSSRKSNGASGDKTNADNNNNAARSRRISFDNTGPRLIPTA
ncbi:Tetraspanin-4 [Orchesella cincta]|uniref:Tetraspanin-4 n=1 Tax=Orchesella cincta TaxID=48709 RepID=A0A1D2NBH3_ORCCI|nr:Tetraspanin-4 [Orchesella cincta]